MDGRKDACMSEDEDAPQGRPARQPLRVFDAWTIRSAVSHRLALLSAQRAFKALARKQVTVPPPLGVELEDVNGEVHVKGAYIHGSPVFAFKVATGFYSNVQFGVPTGSGMVLVFDSETGFPRCVLADNGYLTDLRTAAAGALAAKHLAPDRPLRVASVGAGVQARLQLELLATVRPIAEVRVWSRTAPSRENYATRMHQKLLIPVQKANTVAEAVEGADLILTTTPSRGALIEPGYLASGATVIAVGSDGPEKQELAAEVVASADKVVTDLTAQCVTLGELHHAVLGGHMSMDSVYAELGQIVNGDVPGRESDGETIVCDLTGVGAQDASIAEVAYRILAKGIVEEDGDED
jgi:ornithine cyclodeaminase